MIIVDTLFEHYEVDENIIMTDTSHDLQRKNAIAAMHSTENTLERVTTRAQEICPLNGEHTFEEWEDACIRVLLELHCQGNNKPPVIVEVVIKEERQEASNGLDDEHRQQEATDHGKEVDQAQERSSSGSQTAMSRPSMTEE